MFSYTPLFTLLVQKGMTKTQLREAIGIGTGTLAKMSKGEYVAMEVLDKICNYFECNIEDIINVCDGVMVARGDLALYSTMNRYFFNKSKIVDCAREENKRLFIATDILSSLEHKNFPNRADLCDLHHIVEKKPYGIILKSDFFYYNRSEYALKWISCIR